MDDDAAELVRRIASGDPAALELAYQRYSSRCNAIAYRILHDSERARDAVQEAFLALWRHREGLVVRTAGVAPWLAVVTRNAAITMLRRSSALAQREERAASQDVASSQPDPERLFIASEDTAVVQSALDALSDEQRTVVKLAYYRHMTMAQIAQRTNTPLGTVKRRAQLALRRLSTALEEKLS